MRRHDRRGTPRAAARDRRRQLAWSTWFAIASLYILFAIGAILTAYHAGVEPQARSAVREHAEHVAEIAFESLYSLMLAGADRDRLQQAALRLEHTGTGLSIHFVRGTHIVEEFGELSDSRLLKEHDPGVQAAFRSARPQSSDEGGQLSIAYPVLFRSPCLGCHERSVSGEVAGVIALIYPTAKPIASWRHAILPLVAFFALGFPGVMLITHLVTRAEP